MRIALPISLTNRAGGGYSGAASALLRRAADPPAIPNTDMTKKPATSLRRADFLIPVIIFTCAFAVRMAFVLQAKESPFWRVPLVDARTYDQAARELVNTSWLSPLPNDLVQSTPYPQPPLYQTFLALIYSVFGRSVTAAAVIQYLIGSLTCVLVYLIGLRFFDPPKAGIAAGIATALTATQLFYEGRLLPPVLITFLNLTIILLAAKQLGSPAGWRWPAIGLLIGLSAIARPDILLFLPALIVWMWLERKTVLPHRPALWTAFMLLAALLPIASAGLRNAVVGRDFVPISANGGINFFLGNHPEMEKMLGIRPGIRWEELVYLPRMDKGITKPSECDRYYYKLTFEMMRRYKRATLRNFARKFLWVWHGPEILRNEDEYYLTRVSWLYRLLLWRVGNFGFPYGIIAPLGLVGMLICFRRRRELYLLYAYVATQALMMLAFFPCSRYRAPIVPALLIFGAAAAFEMIALARRRQVRDLLPLLSMLFASGVMSTLSPPKFQADWVQNEAENHRLLATAYYEEGNPEVGIATCEKGLKLAPKNPDLHKWLMDAYYEQGDRAEVEKHALACIRLVPTYRVPYETLVEIYEAEGRSKEAAEIRKAIRSRAAGNL